MRRVTLPVLILLFVLQAQPANNFALTVDNIMRGPALVGYEPTGVRWSWDGNRILFQWKQNTDKEIAPMDTFTVNRDGSGLRKLTDEEVRQLPPALGDTTKDRRLMVYSSAGDLYTLDNTTGKITQLTKTTDAETNPRFTQDGKRISFTRNGNLFVMSLDSGLLVQLTDIRSAAAPATSAAPAATGAGRGFGGGRGQGGGGRGAVRRHQRPCAPEPRGTDSQEYLKKEQKELLQVVRDRVAQREEQQKKRTAEAAAGRKPFTLQARQNVNGLQLTPDEKYVIASVFEAAATPARNTIVPNYITDSVYTEDIPGRSNVGDNQGASRLAILNVETGEVKWVDHGQKKRRPAAARRGRARAPASAERDIQMSAPLWSEDGTKAVISARSADNKDRWLFALDPSTGKTRTLVNIHDDAWVGGPQGAVNTLGWMKNDREVFFISEKTGYAQLYAVPFDGGEPRALTTGNWEVLNVAPVPRQIQVLPDRQRRWPFRPVSLRNARRRRPAHPHLQGARQAHRRPLTRRALHCRRLLVLQQAAGPLRAGEPSAAGSQDA